MDPKTEIRVQIEVTIGGGAVFQVSRGLPREDGCARDRIGEFNDTRFGSTMELRSGSW